MPRPAPPLGALLAGVALSAAARSAGGFWPMFGAGSGDGGGAPEGFPEEGCGRGLPVGGAPPCVGGGAAPGGFFFLEGACVELPGCEVQGPFATYGECVAGCVLVDALLTEDLLQSYYFWDYDYDFIEHDEEGAGER